MRIRAWFMAWMLRMPRPPSLFGVQMSFQALRHKAFEFVSSLTPVYQKFWMMAVSLDMNFLVKRIFDM
jgi:hypothetical protein